MIEHEYDPEPFEPQNDVEERIQGLYQRLYSYDSFSTEPLNSIDIWEASYLKPKRKNSPYSDLFAEGEPTIWPHGAPLEVPRRPDGMDPDGYKITLLWDRTAPHGRVIRKAGSHMEVYYNGQGFREDVEMTYRRNRRYGIWERSEAVVEPRRPLVRADLPQVLFAINHVDRFLQMMLAHAREFRE